MYRTTEVHVFIGCLLDFDGTIIDSTEAIVENWKRLADELGLDHQEILRTSHGRRSIDVLRLLDPSKTNWEYVSAMEARIPSLSSSPAPEIPGARRLLESLSSHQVPYAIVTSGTKALLDGWLGVLQLQRPQYIIVAEDVRIGKPNPEGYSKAREQLSLSRGVPGQFLVMEDAPAGIEAGKTAGCKVLAVATTHTVEQLKAAGAHWVVRDHSYVQIEDGESSSEFRFIFHDLL